MTTSERPVPVLPDVSMNIVPPKAPVIGRVVSNDLCMNGKSASFVRHTVIDVSGTPLEGAFVSGQAFGVIAPGVDDKGKPHRVRLYSIATPTWGEDGEGKLLATTCKRLIDEHKPQRKGDDELAHHLFTGVCSNYLCDLQPGAEVHVSGPNGKRFVLPTDPDQHDYLFVATGTGIAPFYGMVRELLDPRSGPCCSRIHLMMGSPYTTDLLYHREFLDLAAAHENFTYDWAISRERRPDGGRGIYVDTLFRESLDTLGPMVANDRTLIYICGVAGMEHGFFRTMASEGLDAGYFTLKDEIRDIPPSEWGSDQIKRYVKTTECCMLEVY